MRNTIQIANTILAQLGGNRFVAMTGAKQFLATDTGLRFKLPARFAKDGINMVDVDLTHEDDYTMRFSRVRGLNVTPVAERKHQYCWDLQDTFSEVTGLDTHL